MAARQGFEPRQNAPEALVLPLHHRAENETLKDSNEREKIKLFYVCRGLKVYSFKI
jgi:hypothetical protein